MSNQNQMLSYAELREKPTLTKKEAAFFADVSEPTIDVWRRKKKFRCVESCRAVRIITKSFLEYIEG